MRNVVLLCLDTVRKDFFDQYATRLRERADLDFSQCRAASSWSVPSHASMFTGELPHEHGTHTYRRDFSNLSPGDTFLGSMSAHRALGVSANVWAGPSFGFDDLFDEFSDVSPDRRFPKGIDVAQFGQRTDSGGLRRQVAFLKTALAHEHPLASIANGTLVQVDDWLSRLPVANPLDDGASILVRTARSQVRDSDEPFFQFINFMDAHGPLSHIKGYDTSLHEAPLDWTSEDVDWDRTLERDDDTQIERYTGLYGAAIEYLDRKVCAYVDWLDEQTDRKTTVVVTSDHGDELGRPADGGRWGHVESSLSEGLLHVPLLVLNAPDGWEDVDQSAYVSHLALPDMLSGLAQGELRDPTEESIVAERIGHSGRLATVEEHRNTDRDRMIRAIYEGTTKYVWDSIGERIVYRLDPDRPCWQERIEETFDPDRFESRFSEELTAYKRCAEDFQTGSNVDESTRERLEELGYV